MISTFCVHHIGLSKCYGFASFIGDVIIYVNNGHAGDITRLTYRATGAPEYFKNCIFMWLSKGVVLVQNEVKYLTQSYKILL